MRLDRINLSESSSPPADLAFLIESVKRLMVIDSCDYFLFVDEGQEVDEKMLIESLDSGLPVDVWYDPQLLGRSSRPHMIDCVAPTNYFNLPLANGGPLWTISFHGLVVRKELIRECGFLDGRFTTLHGSCAEWVYRMLMSGVFFRPLRFLRQRPSQVRHDDSLEDELRLIGYRFGLKWYMWCLFRSSLAAPLTTFHFLIKGSPVYSTSGIPVWKRTYEGWSDCPVPADYNRVSVIIPTIDRYSYLEKALLDLHNQSVQPLEIIIIDQTDKMNRRNDWVNRSSSAGIKYMTLDLAGQCSSRNLGLRSAAGNYILFIDDDVEFGPGLIEHHLRNLEYFRADVSCGVCNEKGSGPIPPDFTFIRMSDVFPTNNGMVRKSALEMSGLFDLAYDKGQRADGDLGARIYKQGSMMVLNPEIQLFHHHAPIGGLRKHKARKVTFASSRSVIQHFRLPHRTELYLNMRYFNSVQQRESIILHIWGTFSIRGSAPKRLIKVLFAFLSLPTNLFKVFTRLRQARRMLKVYPQIPSLTSHG